MDDNADVKRIMLALSPQGDWRRPPGNTRITWQNTIEHDLTEMSQFHTPWSSWHGSESPSVEAVVDVRCYAILELHARNDDDDDDTQYKHSG